MNKKIIIGALVAILVLAGGVFALVGMNTEETSAPSVDSNTSQTSDSANTTPTDTNPTENQSEAAVITFTNEGFSPGTITVKKGTVVTVKNESSTRVQFSSDDHPTHRENTEMNLKTLATGESATFIAETVGTHGYHDHLDDSKTGTLVITE